MKSLQWIVKEAKSLKRKYPNRFKKWTDYVAQASAIYASKHKGKSPVGHKHKKQKLTGMAKHRKTSRRKTAIRALKRAHRSEGRALRKLGTIGAAKTTLKKRLEKKLGEEYISQFKAKLKRHKKKIGKRISKIKRDIRSLAK